MEHQKIVAIEHAQLSTEKASQGHGGRHCSICCRLCSDLQLWVKYEQLDPGTGTVRSQYETKDRRTVGYDAGCPVSTDGGHARRHDVKAIAKPSTYFNTFSNRTTNKQIISFKHRITCSPTFYQNLFGHGVACIY